MKNSNIKELKDKMLKEYLSSQLIYVQFTSYVENRIKNILTENNIKYQSLDSRVKSYDSLENKLTENIINGIHGSIKNLNDLSGVRVIFYNEEDLRKLRDIISDEFKIESYRPSEDIIKYDGTNITISLKKDDNKFKGMLCEIQLTTVLHHAMNEFGHNIIYKDVDELQSKDSKEYKIICDIFAEARKEILNVIASLELIDKRVDGIKTGAKNIDLLLDKDFNRKLQNVKSLNELETIINKMIEIIPLVNKYEENYKIICNSGIIYSLVKKFDELPVETATFLNYNMYEYIFEKLLEFLKCYKYLWIDDFNNIISILYKLSIKNNIVNKFDDFLKSLFISDKVDSNKGYGNYNIHEIAYSLIFDKNIDEYIRIKLAEYFCNINYDYLEKIEQNKVSLISNKVNPSNNYKNKIYMSIDEVLNIFLNNNSKEALRTLININHELERNNDIFKNNPIYEFFYNNYDRINFFSKNKLYNSVSNWNNSKLKDSKFYNKLKVDKLHILFAMLFNFYIDEIPGVDFAEKEEYKQDYLDKYIKNFNDENVEEIIDILNAMDDEKINDSNLFYAGRFLINIGKLKNYGKDIIKIKWNEYIFLGIVKQDKNYKYRVDDEIKIDKIILAMLGTEIVDLKVLDRIIRYVEKTKNEKLVFDILKLITNNNDLANNEEYKKYLLDKIKQYNFIKKGIIGKLLFNRRTEKQVIEKYSYDELKILIDNCRYSEFNEFDNFFLNNVFEKYPEDIRMILRYKIIDKPNTNLHNSYHYTNLTKCSNYNVERYNNLLLCMEILEKNDCYKVSNYIHYLIGEYTEEVGDDVLKYLNENDNYETYTNVINLCRLFDVSISCWKIFEFIVSKVDENDKLLNEIDCLFFNTGVVSGKYGIANSYYDKYMFFKLLKPKNKKVKCFVAKEIETFKILYQEEKNTRDKEIIKDEVKYKLENIKAGEN